MKSSSLMCRLVAVCALCGALATGAAGQGVPDIENAPAAGNTEGGGIDVDDYGTVDIHVQDTELAQVLQMLSIQSRKNIITSKAVSSTVTATLYDVSFYEALEAILHVNGYGYVEEGNFIYIYTQEELLTIAEASRQRESRIFELNNLSASDAHEFIKPLLSEGGMATALGDVDPGFQPDISNGGEDTYAFAAKLVVNDYPENLDAMAQLLMELDIRPQQVLVESTVVSTAVDESNGFGIDFNIISDLDFTDLTNPLSAVNDLLQGSDSGSDVEATEGSGFQPSDNNAKAIQSTPGNTQGPGTMKVGVISNDVSVFLRVLDEVSDTTVLARPRVLALNRQRAQVLVGIKVGYLSTTATETTTTQTVEFLDTGIQLVFRPFISTDGTIRMELAPSVSEAQLRDATDANGLIVTIPDELTNEITTNVRVRDGETLVLGGLFRESVRASRRQVPVLGDIPLLGAAFRGHDDVIDRDEIIFLITPTIVRDEIMAAIGDEARQYADSVRVAAREGLLPFSREKMSAKQNREALDAFLAGDTEMALYHINNSLRTFPNQPEAIQLREKITGAAHERVHERSFLNRIMQRELEDRMISVARPKNPLRYAGVPATDPLAGGSTFDAPATSNEMQPVETFATPIEEQLDSIDEAVVDAEPVAVADDAEFAPEGWTPIEDVVDETEPVVVADDEPMSSMVDTENANDGFVPFENLDNNDAMADAGNAATTADDGFEPFIASVEVVVNLEDPVVAESYPELETEPIVEADEMDVPVMDESPVTETELAEVPDDTSAFADPVSDPALIDSIEPVSDWVECFGDDAPLMYEVFFAWNPWLGEAWWSDAAWMTDEDSVMTATVVESDS